MLIEFKAPSVSITQEVFDQASIYNRHLHVPYLMLCNGQISIIAEIQDHQYKLLDCIPTYSAIIQ